MEVCENDHEEIVYDNSSWNSVCPACELNKKIETLENEKDNLQEKISELEENNTSLEHKIEEHELKENK